MTRLINLVGTRCTDGNLAALRAWYADHVHQLLACEGLIEAAMFLREGAGQGDAPECLCLYDFESAAAFAEYETGPVRAAAAADRALGWGRDGIEITKRFPLARLYRRSAGAGTLPARWRVRSLRAGAESHRAIVAGIEGDFVLYLAQGDAPTTLVFSAGESALPANVATAWAADYSTVLVWSR